MNPKYSFFIWDKETNLFNPSAPDVALGYAITNNGVLYAHASFNTTGYIPIKPGYRYYFSRQQTGAFFNAAKQNIGGFNNISNPGIVIAPQKAAYLRISVNIASWSISGFTINQLRIVRPTYKDDISKDYEIETNQQFYRPKLSGKITFLRDDFDYIYNSEFGMTFYLKVYLSEDMGVTWSDFFMGKFMKTDCTFNLNDRSLTTQLDVYDEYNDVLAGIEKEYNLIPLKPSIERLMIKKRPLIQVYIPGDSVVSCFIGGSYWEQDANIVTSGYDLVNTYFFSLCNALKEMQVTVNGSPTAANGLYTGRMTRTGSLLVGSLFTNVSNGYRIDVTIQYSAFVFALVTCKIIRISTGLEMFNYSVMSTGSWDNLTFTMNAVTANGATGTATVEMTSYNIYARYLMDVETFRGEPTNQLPQDDIVDYNRNYKRAIGYNIDIAYISNEISTEPTQWGRRDDGKYYDVPYTLYDAPFYPIARSRWAYASIWFTYHFMDNYIEQDGRKTYTLRDTYPISSVIKILLSQFAPNITHEETAEYSQFLYSSSNPITYQYFRLLISPKSNVLIGEYQQPAQKAPITLQQVTNMLRDCYKCFWYIEDGKFKIEHIKFFRNGGSYTETPNISVDLTTIENVRNAKKWGFNTSEWSYDKIDMPERFEFEWMDDVTTIFKGFPINIKSNYVTKGKIENINVSNFTSDIDMMLLNPGSMSNDGFALFSAVKADAMAYYSGNGITSADNGYTTPTYLLRPECIGRDAIFRFTPYSNSGTVTGQIVFYNSSDVVISTQGSFICDGFLKEIAVTIPSNASKIGLYVDGAMSAYLYKLETQQYELPIPQRTIDNVDYYIQNGYLAFVNLQPNFYVYDLPAKNVEINGSLITVLGIDRKKKQTINFPVPFNINPRLLVKTYIGNAQVDKLSINLYSGQSKTSLKYDTE